MSDCCFMHLFKEVIGRAFVAYLNGIRVSRAQSLLASTDKAIAEISPGNRILQSELLRRDL